MPWSLGRSKPDLTYYRCKQYNKQHSTGELSPRSSIHNDLHCHPRCADGEHQTARTCAHNCTTHGTARNVLSEKREPSQIHLNHVEKLGAVLKKYIKGLYLQYLQALTRPSSTYSLHGIAPLCTTGHWCRRTKQNAANKDWYRKKMKQPFLVLHLEEKGRKNMLVTYHICLQCSPRQERVTDVRSLWWGSISQTQMTAGELPRATPKITWLALAEWVSSTVEEKAFHFTLNPVLSIAKWCT